MISRTLARGSLYPASSPCTVVSVDAAVHVARRLIKHQFVAEPCTMHKYVAPCFDKGAGTDHQQHLGRDAEANITSQSAEIPSALRDISGTWQTCCPAVVPALVSSSDPRSPNRRVEDIVAPRKCDPSPFSRYGPGVYTTGVFKR